MDTTRPFLRILIAEDNDDVRELLAYQFRAAGFLVTTAIDGLQALDFVNLARGSRRPYAVLLLDHAMPRMTGGEVAECVRAYPLEHPQEVRPLLIGYSAYTPQEINVSDQALFDEFYFKLADADKVNELPARLWARFSAILADGALSLGGEGC